MNARQVPEFPWRRRYDEAEWAGLVKSFEHEFADDRGAEHAAVTNGTNGLDLALQCLMDSYRALFGLW